MGGNIIVHTTSIRFESVKPSRTEIIEAIEGYAYDKLEELGIDMSDAETTKVVVEDNLTFVEIKASGVKYVARVLEKDTVPGRREAAWLVHVEQY